MVLVGIVYGAEALTCGSPVIRVASIIASAIAGYISPWRFQNVGVAVSSSREVTFGAMVEMVDIPYLANTAQFTPSHTTPANEPEPPVAVAPQT